MKCQVILLLAATFMQVRSAPGNGDATPSAATQDPLSPEDNAKIALELQKLKQHGERFKQEIQKSGASFPGLQSLTESLVNSVNNQAKGFVKFGKERRNALKSPNGPPKGFRDSQLRRNIDALKNLEKQFVSNVQATIGQNRGRKGGAATPARLREVSRAASRQSRTPTATTSL